MEKSSGQKRETCPLCGGKLRPVRELVDKSEIPPPRVVSHPSYTKRVYLVCESCGEERTPGKI